MNIIDYKIDAPIVVNKTWGREVWLFNDEKLNVCTKLLEIQKDTGFHFHFHLEKSESFFCNEGRVKYFEVNPATREINSCILEKGNSIFIKKGTIHSLLALENSVVIETSTFHQDSDSYRTHKNPEIIN